MRKITRLELNKRTTTSLKNKGDILKVAISSWKSWADIDKLQKWYDPSDVKSKLKQMQDYDNELLCCYCETKKSNAPFEIEHIKPKWMPLYQEFTFDWDNLLYSCRTCNGGYKQDRYEEWFLDPSDDDYIFNDHFEIEEICFFKTKTEEAKINEWILEMNTRWKHPFESRQKLKLDLIEKLELYKRANLPKAQIQEFIKIDFRQRWELPTFWEWFLWKIIN